MWMANRPLISVVDGDDSVRESLQSLLRSLGYAVKVFASAEEFLNSDHFCNTDCLDLFTYCHRKIRFMRSVRGIVLMTAIEILLVWPFQDIPSETGEHRSPKTR